MGFLYHRIKVTAHHCHFKLTKKQVLNILVLMSGLVFLSLQIWETFQTFIEKRSTFAISKESFDSLKMPAIIVCPRFQWDIGVWTNGKPADKKWYFGQLYQLNNQFNLTLGGEGKKNLLLNDTLVLGENYDEEGNPFLRVEELMNPSEGLCYALVFNQMYRLGSTDFLFIIASFEKDLKIPRVDFNIVSPEDRYGYILYNRGNLESLTFSSEGGIVVMGNIQRLKWNYLSFKKDCKHYSTKDDTYMDCMLKSHIECYLSNGPLQACKCVPENSFKTHFEMYTTSWNACQTTLEYQSCLNTWWDCSFRKYASSRRKCPLACTKETFRGQKWIVDGYGAMVPQNEVMVRLQYTTMDVEIHDEVLIQELSNFIGTVGGSLGLFIGFSYTGFVGKLIDLLFELF